MALVQEIQITAVTVEVTQCQRVTTPGTAITIIYLEILEYPGSLVAEGQALTQRTAYSPPITD
jgi:hypothetical protein